MAETDDSDIEEELQMLNDTASNNTSSPHSDNDVIINEETISLNSVMDDEEEAIDDSRSHTDFEQTEEIIQPQVEQEITPPEDVKPEETSLDDDKTNEEATLDTIEPVCKQSVLRGYKYTGEEYVAISIEVQTDESWLSHPPYVDELDDDHSMKVVRSHPAVAVAANDQSPRTTQKQLVTPQHRQQSNKRYLTPDLSTSDLNTSGEDEKPFQDLQKTSEKLSKETNSTAFLSGASGDEMEEGDPMAELGLGQSESGEYDAEESSSEDSSDIVKSVLPPFILQYKRESEEEMIDYDSIVASAPPDMRWEDMSLDQQEEYRALVEEAKRNRKERREAIQRSKKGGKQLISLEPHATYGSKHDRKAAKERAAEKLKAREAEKSKLSAANTSNQANFYSFARQLKTVSYSLSSEKCMEEGWTVRPESPETSLEPSREFLVHESDSDGLGGKLGERKRGHRRRKLRKQKSMLDKPEESLLSTDKRSMIEREAMSDAGERVGNMLLRQGKSLLDKHHGMSGKPKKSLLDKLGKGTLDEPDIGVLNDEEIGLLEKYGQEFLETDSSSSDDEDDLDISSRELLSELHNRYRGTFVQKFYDNGQVFLCVFSDGTGTVWYPSGNVAISIIATEKSRKCMFMIHEDKELEEGPQIQAVFEPDGNCTCYYPSGRIRTNLSAVGGEYYSLRGERLKRWRWRDTETHVHAPPFQPITFGLSKQVGVRIISQDGIYVTFTDGRRSVRINVGTRLRLRQPVPKPVVDSDTMLLQDRTLYIQSLIQKLHCTFQFPHSPRRAKIKLPHYLNAQLERLHIRKSKAVDKLPPLKSELLQSSQKSLVPDPSASAAFPKIRHPARYRAARQSPIKSDTASEMQFSVTVN